MKTILLKLNVCCLLLGISSQSNASHFVSKTLSNHLKHDLITFGVLSYDTPAGVVFTNQFNACLGWTVTYQVTNTTNVLSTNWDVSNTKYIFDASNISSYSATNLTYAFNDTGTFVLRLNLNSGTSIQRYFYDTIYNAFKLKPLPVFLPLDSQRICYGNSYTMDFGNDNSKAIHYLWMTGQAADTLRTLTRSDSNSYILQITDSFNCQNQDTFRLYVNPPVLANAGADIAICKGDTTTLHASGGQLYQWRNLTTGSVILAKGYTNTICVKPAITTQYEVIVFSSYPDTANKNLECSAVDTIQITVNPLPILSRPTSLLACKSNKILSLIPFGNNQPGGVEVWSYPSNKGAISNGSQAKLYTDSLTKLPADSAIPSGSYDNWIYYKYTAPSNFGGCSSYDSAKVSVYTVPYIKVENVTWCKNAGIFKLQADNTRSYPYNTWVPTPNDVVGNTYGQESTWKGPGVDSIFSGLNKRYTFNPNRSDVAAMNTLSYSYTKTYVNGFTCTGVDSVIKFKVSTIPLVSAGTLSPVCNLDTAFSLTLKSNATTTGSKGYWTYVPVANLYGINDAMKDSQNFFPTKINIPNGSLIYSWKLVYNDASTGCAASDTTTIIVAANPNITLSLDNPADSIMWLSTGVKTLTATSTPLGGIGSYSCSPITSAYAVDLVNPTKSLFNTNDSTLIPGKYWISYSYKIQVPGYSLQCANSDKILINVRSLPGVGINTITKFSDFNIYPNPTSGLLTIELVTSEKKVDIEVFDLIGKLMIKNSTAHDGGVFQKTLDLSSLHEGIYFVKISVVEKSTTVKVTLK